jgi:indole-3-acetate monooxygenase
MILADFLYQSSIAEGNPMGSTDQARDIVEKAKALVPAVIELRAEAERMRKIPQTLVDLLAQAGLLQMYLPRSVGGPELDPLTAFTAIEELSRADGSVGWCAMLASDVSMMAGWLNQETLFRMVGDPPAFRGAGSLRPQGKAWPVNGGYRVKGQWNFASGIDHSNWLYCPSIVMDGDKAATNTSSAPRVRAMWIPTSDVTIIDTWSTLGMRATGSHDFVADDIFVPEDPTCFLGEPPPQTGPLFNPRMFFVALWSTTVANAVGIARGAIDDFITLASRDGSTQSTALLRDRPAVQAKVAEAEAILNAARAYVITAVGAAWAAVKAGEADPSRKIAHARLAITHAMHEAVRSVDIVFRVAGTNAIHTRNPIERHFRDIHVALQHNSAFPAHYESAGKALMGLKPSDPGW